MTVKWADIVAEYEDSSHKERAVRLFQKYEGQETDQIVRGKPLKVSQRSFAAHIGVNQQTFNGWVTEFSVTESRLPTCINEGIPSKQGIFLNFVDQLEAFNLPGLRYVTREDKDLYLTHIDSIRLWLDKFEIALKEN